MVAFFRETGVRVALDESLDEGLLPTAVAVPPTATTPFGGPGAGAGRGPLGELLRDCPGGLAAVVIKPSAVGGVGAALALARAGRAHGAAPLLSAAFESSVGVAALAQLAAAIDADAPAGGGAPAWHGLGTLGWLAADALSPPLWAGAPPGAAPLGDADRVLSAAAAAAAAAPPAAVIARATAPFEGGGVWGLTAVEPRGGAAPGAPTLLFLHGFLGDGGDWLPAMAALATAAGARCIAPDLPGHGRTTGGAGGGGVEGGAAALAALAAAQGWRRPVLVGYSLGARIALALATGAAAAAGRDGGGAAPPPPPQLAALALVSGSAGLEGAEERAARAGRDAGDAALLRALGGDAWVSRWYDAPMWAPLRAHPRFGRLLAARRAAAAAPGAAAALAAALEACSPGRTPSAWPRLPRLAGATPTLLIAGGLDAKFVATHRAMAARIAAGSGGGGGRGSGGWAGGPPPPLPGAGADGAALAAALRADGVACVEVAGAGHALPTERPDAIVAALLGLLAALPAE